uniref:Uncharacterized protein n=1 Tax=Magallana gigas TaxID=29159 RepID=K1Q4W9_MAGGI
MKSVFVRSVTSAQNELLQNDEFESSSFHGNWFCKGCSITSYTADVYQGTRSVKVTHSNWVPIDCKLTSRTDDTYHGSRTLWSLTDSPIFVQTPLLVVPPPNISCQSREELRGQHPF